MDTFIFSGLLWPPQPRRSDGKPQILMWILMWKKGKNLVYLYVKLSILSIGGPRLIFMNSNKCPTMWLIKKWDVALSSRFVWRYSFSQLSIRNLGYLVASSYLTMISILMKYHLAEITSGWHNSLWNTTSLDMSQLAEIWFSRITSNLVTFLSFFVHNL